MTRRVRRKTVFTLLELLIVVAIIAMLAALLLPALRKAKKTAESMLCLSQLRQFGQANFNYASDNKEFLPVSDTANQLYDYLLASYVGYDWANRAKKSGFSVYHCPSATPNIIVNNYRSRGYAYNRLITVSNQAKTAFLPGMETPSLMLLMADTFTDAYSGDPHEEHIIGLAINNPGFINISGSAFYIDYRHANLVNALFGDGHVKSSGKGMAAYGGFIIKDSKWYNGGTIY